MNDFRSNAVQVANIYRGADGGLQVRVRDARTSESWILLVHFYRSADGQLNTRIRDARTDEDWVGFKPLRPGAERRSLAPALGLLGRMS